MYEKPEGFSKIKDKTSLTNFILAQLIIIFSLPLIAFIYVKLIQIFPFVYLNFLITYGSGILLSVVVLLITKICKIKSYFIVMLLNFMLVFLLKYFEWVIYVPDAIGKINNFTVQNKLSAYYFLMENPYELIKNIFEINKIGTWQMFGLQINGKFLFFIWIAEVIIVLISAVISISDISKNPFFDFEKKNLKKVTTLGYFNNFDFGRFRNEFEEGNFSYLIEKAGEKLEDNENFFEPVFYTSQYEDKYYLSLFETTKYKNENGAISSKSVEKAELIPIDKRSAKIIIERLNETNLVKSRSEIYI